MEKMPIFRPEYYFLKCHLNPLIPNSDSIPMLPADTEETTTSPPVVDGSAELDASNALSALEEVPVPPPPRRSKKIRKDKSQKKNMTHF